MEIRPVDTQIARYFSLKQAQGVIVSDVKKGSPADRAGVQIADIILDINGERILNDDTLVSIMNDSRSGDTWNMKVYRDKKIISIKMKLEKEPK